MKNKTEPAFYTHKSETIYNSFFSHTNDNSPIPTLQSLQKKYKTSTDHTPPSKESALRRAAHQGNIQDIEHLINEYEADVKSKSTNGFTALDWAYLNH